MFGINCGYVSLLLLRLRKLPSQCYPNARAGNLGNLGSDKEMRHVQYLRDDHEEGEAAAL